MKFKYILHVLANTPGTKYKERIQMACAVLGNPIAYNKFVGNGFIPQSKESMQSAAFMQANAFQLAVNDSEVELFYHAHGYVTLYEALGQAAREIEQHNYRSILPDNAKRNPRSTWLILEMLYNFGMSRELSAEATTTLNELAGKYCRRWHEPMENAAHSDLFVSQLFTNLASEVRRNGIGHEPALESYRPAYIGDSQCVDIAAKMRDAARSAVNGQELIYSPYLAAAMHYEGLEFTPSNVTKWLAEQGHEPRYSETLVEKARKFDNYGDFFRSLIPMTGVKLGTDTMPMKHFTLLAGESMQFNVDTNLDIIVTLKAKS